ncbi:MAG TPA: ribonuclease III domain-containing protein [Methylomirabilota bacterium]|nr:ribonuclease III domain-containing protein [Methylomirabilota bacterium]
MPSASAARTPRSPSASIVPSADDLEALEARLGYRFRDRALLLEALTHRSYANEHPDARDNEALAFLGDAVLALVVAQELRAADRDAAVGALTLRRAALVSGPNLARWAERLALGSALRLGRGEQQTGGAAKESVLATAFEAVLGAVYLEAGVAAARRVVASLALW